MKSKIVAIVLSLLCIGTLTGCNLNELGALLPEEAVEEVIAEEIAEVVEEAAVEEAVEAAE